MRGGKSEGAMIKLIERIKALLLTPHTEWPVIERERTTALDLFVTYAAILAAIPEVAHLIGQSFVGEARAPFLSGLLRAVISYAVSLAAVYVIAGVIDLLAPRFGAKKNFPNALKLSVYSYTPLWLAGIFLIVPGLNFLLVLGFYGFYLLWIGLPLLMQVPNSDGEALRYTAVAAACALVPLLVLAIV
jgi:Yip1 domain